MKMVCMAHSLQCSSDVMMLMVQNDGHSSAIKDYDEVIRIDPTLAKAYNNRGYCHQNLNNHEQGTGTCYEWYRGECHWHRRRIVTDVVQLATSISIHPQQSRTLTERSSS